MGNYSDSDNKSNAENPACCCTLLIDESERKSFIAGIFFVIFGIFIIFLIILLSG